MIEQIFGIIIAFFGALIAFAMGRLVVRYWKDGDRVSAVLMSWFIIMGGSIFLYGVGMAIVGVPK